MDMSYYVRDLAKKNRNDRFDCFQDRSRQIAKHEESSHWACVHRLTMHVRGVGFLPLSLSVYRPYNSCATLGMEFLLDCPRKLMDDHWRFLVSEKFCRWDTQITVFYDMLDVWSQWRLYASIAREHYTRDEGDRTRNHDFVNWINEEPHKARTGLKCAKEVSDNELTSTTLTWFHPPRFVHLKFTCLKVCWLRSSGSAV